MPTYYWVGGSGTWNNSNTANWSATSGGAGGAGFPVAGDIVFLDAASGAAVVTLGANITMNTINFTGFTGTVAWGSFVMNLAGTGTLYTGVSTVTMTGTPVVNITTATATSRTVIGGSSIAEGNTVSFNVTAGTGLVTIGGSIRDLNYASGFTGRMGGGTRIVFGSLTITSGVTVDSSTGITTFASTSGTKTITTSGKTLDFPITFSGIGGTWQFTDALTLGATRALLHNAGSILLKEGVTSTVGSFGGSTSSARALRSAVSGTTATLSDISGTNTLINTTLQDIAATGGATWLAYFTSGNANQGNTTGFIFFPPGLSAGRGLSIGSGLYEGSPGLWESRIGL